MDRKVCVFDLDDTLQAWNCNGNSECIRKANENAKNVINYCKSNNMNIAINTARSSSSLEYIPHEIVKVLPADINKNFYHRGLIHGPKKSVVQQKKMFMDDIAKKFDAKKENMILFDDRLDIIKTVQSAGYSASQPRRLGRGCVLCVHFLDNRSW